jgi:hypothetical protein
VLDGGVGKMIDLARSNLRSIPGPKPVTGAAGHRRCP